MCPICWFVISPSRLSQTFSNLAEDDVMRQAWD
jgi:hypothetical protein